MKLKIGILSFAHMHAMSYVSALANQPNAEIVAASGLPKLQNGQLTKLTYSPDARYYDEASELLAAERELDAVIVTSENVHHRSLVEQAAQSGVKAILCEKPLATTVEDAQAMIDTCAAHGVRLATAFPCRYSPAYQRLREQVQAGAIGDVLAIRATNRGSMPGGWFIDRALSGGGAVIDHTVHVADLNRFLLCKEAVSVYAEIGHGFYHQDWDDTGFLTINYDGGVFGTLDTSWSRPKTFPTWGDVTMEVVGTRGVLNLDMFAQHLIHYNDKTGRAAWAGWGSNTDAGLVTDFLRLTAGTDAPGLATGLDGLRALEVALAAYRSAETGTVAAI